MSGFAGERSAGPEREVLDRAYERAAAGLAETVVVVGGHGSGRTSLVRTVAERVAGLGGRVVWGRASGHSGAPTFWPWQEIVRQLGHDGPGTSLAELLAVRGTGDAARFRLFDRVVRALRESTGPLLVVLDDMDAADRSSVELLRHVASSLRTGAVLLVVTATEPAALLGPADEHVVVVDLGGEPPASSLGLDRFSPAARSALAAWAIMGTDAGSDRSLRVAGLADAPAAEVTTELVAAGVLTGDGEPGPRLPDLARAAWSGLGHEDRQALHLRALDVLAAEGAATGLLARHVRAALAAVPAARAYRVLVEAGRRAARDCAWEDARRDLEPARALAHAAGAEPADVVELDLTLGEVHLRCGDMDSARRCFDAAGDGARSLGDAAAQARAALGRGGWFVDYFEPDLELIAALRQARSAPQPLAARVSARLAIELPISDPGRASLLAEAESSARRIGDTEALWLALQARGAHPQLAALDQRIAIADELLGLAERQGDPHWLARAHGWRFAVAVEAGDAVAADAHLSARLRWSGRVGDAYLSWHDEVFRAVRALLDGDLDEAEERMDAALRLGGERMGRVGPYMAHGIQRHELLVARGDLDAALDHVEVQHQRTGFPGWRCARAALLARRGDLPAAANELDALAAAGFETLPDAYVGTCVAMLAEACAAVGAADHARRLLPLVTHLAGTMVVTGYGGGIVACHGSAERALGLLAAATGDLDGARALLAAAHAGHQRCGWPALVSVTEQDLATVGSPPPAPRRRAASLVRTGEMWQWRFGGEVVDVPNRVGTRYLARLLAMPNVEIPALDLVGAETAGAGIPLLDDTAKAHYRKRVAELEGELDDADRDADYVRAERLQLELDALMAELRRAVGLADRRRVAGSDVERARSAATKAIRNEIRRLAAGAPALAHYLSSRIRTGTACAFVPDPNVAVDWTVSSTGR